MTDQERQDLDKLHVEVKSLKVQAFDTCKSYIRMQPEELKHTGHKSIEAAVLSTMKYYDDKCIKLTKEYIKKYPD